ncbi:unnamed protein product [Pylaiella littoralis]
MASLNPPIVDDLSHLALPRHAVVLGFSSAPGGREVLLGRRGGMHLDLSVPTVGRFRATGVAFLTTDRIVFCASQPHGSQNGMPFKGFDIPLEALSGEKFEQPILFGANNLSGLVETNVAYAGSLSESPAAVGFHGTASPIINSTWRLSFRNGGFGTFLRVFFAALERRRLVNPAVPVVAFAGTDDQWASLQATEVVQAVALDPTDGTVLLTPAPVQATAPARLYGDL